MAGKLIILRHGQSTWNEQDLFTGWVDIPLSGLGTKEAIQAGHLLAEDQCLPDIVYTSLLRRSITTANLALDKADRHWIPAKRSWELNERHYGGLQGKNKAEAAEKFGNEQVHPWRRSYDVPPPSMTDEEFAAQVKDERYTVEVPRTECLKDVLERVMPLWERVMPFWKMEIAPGLREGKTVLIAAHGNSLRALMKELEEISDEEIPGREIPTGIPIVYVLDEGLKPVGGKGRWLG